MWFELDWQAWATLAIILGMLVALVRDIARPDVVLLSVLGILVALGILSTEEALGGIANPAVLTVGSLFVVAAGVQNTGALIFVDGLLFPKTNQPRLALLRVMLTTAVMSAFLNNTPIVAMFIPRIQAWCENKRIPASKLLMPLSYAAILGGMTTLIGTSTNLVVAGLLQNAGYEPLGLFDLSLAGIPAALIGILYFLTIGYRFLPTRNHELISDEADLQNCLYEMRVASASPLVGQTIEEAQLRHLETAYLGHIYRNDEIMPVSPQTILQPGDILTFIGRADIVRTLRNYPGLQRVVPQIAEKEMMTLPLYEAIIAPTSNLVGRTLREANFREIYQGVVLGIHRRDATIDGPLGNEPLQAGDLLIIEAQSDFDKRWNRRRDEFYVVAPRSPEETILQKTKAPLALLILLLVVLLAALDLVPISTTSFLGALAMVLTRCLPRLEAQRSVDFPVLVVIASALGVGLAVQRTGLADAIAQSIVQTASPFGTIGILAAVYVATSLLTEMITNNAAAALMLPIGLATAQEMGMNPLALAVTVAIAASASFMTPIGYQTNLMVMSAGGYRFGDYARSGVLLYLLVAFTSVTAVWYFWL